MAVDVQPFALLLFRHAQPDGHIRHFVADERHNAGPDHGDGDTFQLHQQLMAHGDAFRITDAAQRSRREDTSQDTADDAADAVNAEDVARIIHTQPAFQRSHAPDTRQARGDTDDQRPADTDITTRRRNANQTGNCPGAGAQQ